MLQQTTVQAVVPYFQRWMNRLPTLEALAQASSDEMMDLWQGLGYYSRVRNMHRTAQILVAQGGKFPKTEKELRSLPGIGPYTAGALLTIAFGQEAVALDGNIVRVLSRYFARPGIGEDLKKCLKPLAQSLLPPQRFGDYTQGLMDLGARICTPQTPQCSQCPVSETCQAFLAGMPRAFPQKAPKLIRPTKYRHAFWMSRPADGAMFLECETTERLLRGLWRFPFSGMTTDPDAPVIFPILGNWTPLDQTVRHVFTHFTLCLRIWKLEWADSPFDKPGAWVLPENVFCYATSSLMKKILGIIGAESK